MRGCTGVARKGGVFARPGGDPLWRGSHRTVTTPVPTSISYGRRRMRAGDILLRHWSMSSAFTSILAPSSSSSNSDYDKWSSGQLHDRYRAIVREKQQQGVASPEDEHQEEEDDAIQLQALRSLERLRHDLLLHPPPPPPTAASSYEDTGKNGLPRPQRFTGWFGSHSWMKDAIAATATITMPKRQQQPPLIPGVYLHGGTGCGKTFLMNDIFHDSLQDTAWCVQRQKIHFQSFLLRVHEEMHKARHAPQNNNNTSADSLLPIVATQIAATGRLLCLDEFQVTDVADAMILQRLFAELWDRHGCVLVATSNRPPVDLYRDGLQRDRFLPFVFELQRQCQVVFMRGGSDSDINNHKDYRMVMKQRDDNDIKNRDTKKAFNTTRAATIPPVVVAYYTGMDGWRAFDAQFVDWIRNGVGDILQRNKMSASSRPKKSNISSSFGSNKMATVRAVPTMIYTALGRTVSVPLAHEGICRFKFAALCQHALGAADYIAIAQAFSVVFVEDIPIMKLEHINWVRRFIVFVDTMYEAQCTLILHAQTRPEMIFQPNVNSNDTSHDEVFAFQRTLSRLQEMSSQTYLQKIHQPRRNDDDLPKKIKDTKDVLKTLSPPTVSSNLSLSN